MKPGDTVLLLNLNTTATLLEPAKEKKKVQVRLGNINTTVETSYIRGNPQQKNIRKKEKSKVSMNIEAEPQGRSSCDLRGMSSEEAETKMEAFISHAIVTKVPRITIIHGHGMGTIKTLVRNYLEKTGICRQFSPGRREEGGNGVTIVEF